jgi:ADP-ribosylglycohydrolase
MSFLPIFYGLALGDAIGWPVEFQKLNQIRASYGPRGIAAPPNPALFTDDTQMTLAVSEALIEAGDKDIETLLSSVSAKFVAWSHHPDTPGRAPGNTCLRGVSNLEKGQNWGSVPITGRKAFW